MNLSASLMLIPSMLCCGDAGPPAGAIGDSLPVLNGFLEAYPKVRTVASVIALRLTGVDVKMELVRLKIEDAATLCATLESYLGLQPARGELLICLPRWNSIIVAAPKGRLLEIKSEIRRLDAPPRKMISAAIQLKHAPGKRIVEVLFSFAADRGLDRREARFFADEEQNLLWIQATADQMKEIKELVRRFDTNCDWEKRTICLRSAIAAEVALVIEEAHRMGALGIDKDQPLYVSKNTETNCLVIYAPRKSMKAIIAEVVSEFDNPLSSSLRVFTFEKKGGATKVALSLRDYYLGGCVHRDERGKQIVFELIGWGKWLPLSVRATVDEKTNSLILCGRVHDLEKVEAVIESITKRLQGEKP